MAPVCGAESVNVTAAPGELEDSVKFVNLAYLVAADAVAAVAPLPTGVAARW
jgi:hypothetical protein